MTKFARLILGCVLLLTVHETKAAGLPNNLGDLSNIDFEGIFQALQAGLQSFGSSPVTIDLNSILSNPTVQVLLQTTPGLNQTIIQYLPVLQYIANETFDAVGSLSKLYGTLQNLNQNLTLPNIGGAGSARNGDFMQMIQNLNRQFNIQGAVEGYIRREIYKLQADTGIPADCFDDLELVLGGLLTSKPWALKMFDAVGKPTTGMMWGRLQWLGTRPECLEVDEVVKRNMTVNFRDTIVNHHLKGEYCVASMPFPESVLAAVLGQDGGTQNTFAGMGKPQIELGICVPRTCSSKDIKQLINGAIGSYLNASKVICDADKERDIKEDSVAMAALVFVSLFAALILFATIFEGLDLQNCFAPRYHDYPMVKSNGVVNNGFVAEATIETATEANDIPKKTENGHVTGNGVNGHAVTVNSTNEELILNGHRLSTVQMLEIEEKKEKPQEKKPSIGVQLLSAFSLYNNLPKIMATKQSPSAITCLHGMRVLSICWVILGHVYAFNRGQAGFIFGNPFKVMADSQRFSFYAILSGTLSVDTFFFMSGLLVTYLFLRQLKKEKRVSLKTMLLYYFHRYWRLTPIYMIIIWLNVALLPYLTAGPQKQLMFYDESFCRKNAWTNLLYINNLVNPKEQCAGWGWYLANDMQFYVVAPLFLIPLFLKPIVGIILVLGAFAGSLLARGLVIGGMDNPNMFANPNFFVDVYIRPWCRIGPYLVGMMIGYILYAKECKMKIHKAMVFIGWLVGLFVIMCMVYVQYDQVERKVRWSKLSSMVFETLWRSVWSFGLGWIVVACANGYGGFINSILSWSFWVPLSKLTYATYLIHPVLMYMYNQNMQQVMYGNDYTLAYKFIGDTMVSFAGALVASLAFEAPFLGLEKILLGLFGLKR